MPIAPEHRWLYPIDWPELSRLIRFTHAKGRCEHCRRPHGRNVLHLGACPGWDLYALHNDFESWVAADPQRTPANCQRAFTGWVKRHHEKHRHSLRG